MLINVYVSTGEALKKVHSEISLPGQEEAGLFCKTLSADKNLSVSYQQVVHNGDGSGALVPYNCGEDAISEEDRKKIFNFAVENYKLLFPADEAKTDRQAVSSLSRVYAHKGFSSIASIWRFIVVANSHENVSGFIRQAVWNDVQDSQPTGQRTDGY